MEIGVYSVRKLLWNEPPCGGLAVLHQPVIDIRRWEGKKPQNGITLTDTMIAAVVMLIPTLLDDKAATPILSGDHQKVHFDIYKIIGKIGEIDGCQMLITLTAFNGGEKKYDIRPWAKDFSFFASGCRMSCEEFCAMYSFFWKYIEKQKIAMPKIPLQYQHDATDDLLTEVLIRSGNTAAIMDLTRIKKILQFL